MALYPVWRLLRVQVFLPVPSCTSTGGATRSLCDLVVSSWLVVPLQAVALAGFAAVALRVMGVTSGVAAGLLSVVGQGGALVLWRNLGEGLAGVPVIAVVETGLLAALLLALRLPSSGLARVLVAGITAVAAGPGLDHLALRVGQREANRQQARQIAGLSFTPYVLDRPLPGYRHYDLLVSGSPEQVTSTYLYGRNDPQDPHPITLIEWPASAARFDPPRDCGYDFWVSTAPGDPALPPVPCVRAGQMPDGSPIWSALDTTTSAAFLVVRPGDGTTHVVVQFTLTTSVPAGAVEMVRALKPDPAATQP